MRHLLSRNRLIGGVAVLVLLGGGFWVGELSPQPAVPTFEHVLATYRSSETALLDRHGEVLHVTRSDFSGRRLSWTPLGRISPALTRSVIAAEDRRFHGHEGVDVLALLGSASALLRLERPRGASTISMQLAGLLLPDIAPRSGGRTLAQKWRQMRAAWAIETLWSKAGILEAYLNLVSYRSELKGISAAARALFDKDPSGLNLREAAILAALIRAPNAPPARVAARACALLDGDCVRIEASVSKALTPPYRVRRAENDAYHALHRLAAPVGPAEAVPSTLDAGLQRFVLQVVQNHVEGVADRNLHDAAVIVADNATGEVLAYVGSSGDLSEARFVDGVQARRQAGSTLKPFIYGLAIERRYLTAATLLDDSPIEIPIAASGVYRPRNYDGIFRGPVTVREALASSLNTPAVRTILSVGPEEAVVRLSNLGLRNLMAPEFYGASLALGSADVTLWELTNAYRALANGGLRGPLRLSPRKGVEPERRVMAQGPAFIVTSILSDRDARSLGFGLDSPLATPYFSAVKTGTSKDMRDNWCIGFSDAYTVGVWAGNFSGEPMWNVSGISGAAPIWRDIMDRLNGHRPGRMPLPPKGVHAHRVAIAPTGKVYEEWFLAGTEPTYEVARPRPSEARPRILYPTNGTILAVDPDIPRTLQKVVFQASEDDEELSWVLNGRKLGPIDAFEAWSPEPGEFQLSLEKNGGEPVDHIRFSVR